MILGLSIAAFTMVHVTISLISIVTGLAWLIAQVRGKWLPRTNLVFLVTTIATSVTGFFFPFTAITPAMATGIVSLAVLAVAVTALGLWGPHRVYTAAAAIGLYLNCFVLVVQSFLKIGALHALAPTQTEPPVAAAQGVVLVALVALGWIAIRRSRVAVSAPN